MRFPYDDYIDLISIKNNQAFETVYFETYKGVFSMIFSIVQDRNASEDLMQDTYIKMVEKIHSYEKGRNFPAWLLQIAKNTAYDYLRKKNTENETNSLLAVHHPTTTLPQSEVEQVEEYLSMLSLKEREVMVLRIVNQCSFSEMAFILQKPLGTIYSDYRAATKKMKDILRKEQL